MAEWFSVAGDTRRQFATLTGGDGAPLDLTGMTPVLRIAEATGGRRFRPARGTPVIIQAGEDPDPITDQGVVAYDPAASDVAAPGDYLCQWQMTDGQSKLRTVPDQDPFLWRITPRLQ
jgi:hypothetical protein